MLPARRREPGAVAAPWLRVQAMNVTRHAANLRPFRRNEFGEGSPAPSAGQMEACNRLLGALRETLLKRARAVSHAAAAARRNPSKAHLDMTVRLKDRAHAAVEQVERVWDFYFEIFNQRQTEFGEWLAGCDRIALDCYQDAFVNLGLARSVPSPAPFTHMKTGRSPATFRRGIFLRRLRQQNPFPLVVLPYHRLLNPWTLGAVLHEVCHNLENELGLAKAIPEAVGRVLRENGLPSEVAAVWTRWERELFADIGGLLLGGPAVVESLMDVVGKSPEVVLSYNPQGVHPTPYLRVFCSTELLRRMGFSSEARRYAEFWSRIYPNPRLGTIPRAVLETFPRACALVVETMAYQPYAPLGNKALAQVFRFGLKEQRLIEQAARRLASGTDPGILPERYLIGAARHAIDHGLARPEVVTRNFYRDLARR
ncbi:MAG: hypothetical protein IPM24_19835 [Bryobacterales bacterium]|nr:hypothetical protein [Bryobacterales bacterium]